MTWNKYRMFHSQKDLIDLYCRQTDDKVEICITNGNDKKLKVLIHDFLIGNMSDLFLDQYSNNIEWELTNIDFKNYPAEFDMAAARQRHGHMDSLDFLKYHVANSINSTYSNRRFSKYLKKNIVGKWVEKELTLEFYPDDTYIFEGKWKPSTTLSGVPEKGKYQLVGNMLLFWENENSGLRTQIVDIVNNRMYLPGFSGQLFFTMTKK